MQRVKVQAGPGQTVHFPELCVHCLKPATAWTAVERRLGRLTRAVDVPVCTACAQMLRRRSQNEERWQQLTPVLRVVAFLLAALVAWFLIPPVLTIYLRLALVVVVGLAAVVAAGRLAGELAARAALPEKKAIRQAARIAHFSWRATHFEFDNDAYAVRFRAANEAALMD